VVVVLSISSGYSPQYLLKEVATGRENYYTGAVAEGEPPGRWWGAGAAKLGLRGLVDAQDMQAVYERFLDPRDEAFRHPDRWDAASTLGHTGRKYLSEDELYARALEREPDASPERRAELRTEAGKAARHNVAFFDLTFSVQKSVTLLHTAFEAEEVAARNAGDDVAAAAWGQYRRAVEAAIWAGNNAMLAYLAEKAGYSRVGHHGGAAGRYVDAHGWTVASFFQHDSRDHDPQLHVHNATLNRAEGPDGQWRTLDGRSLYRWRAAGAAVGERTLQEWLTHALGVRLSMRPDGKSREVLGVSQEAMDLISSRRRAVTAKAEELIAAYEATTGRAANGLVRDRLQRQATFATRRAKSHDGESREQVLARVDAQIRAEIGGGLAGVARAALAARAHATSPHRWSPQAVIETALEEVQASKAGWTESDLIRALNNALPDYLGIPDGTDVARLLDSLAEQALRHAQPLDAARPGEDQLPAELRLANGASAYQAPGARLYATPGHVRTERALLAASTAGGATALPPEQARAFLAKLAGAGIELGVDQAAAVRGVLTSGARVETLVGPAGTGKSFVVGAIARAWTDAGHTTSRSDLGGEEAADTRLPRRVFGLATSQVATDVLAAEGLTARNVAAWLAAQRRLTTSAGTTGPRPLADDEALRLHSGDLVVVDESAMTDTAALAAVHKHVDAAGAKLLLVGDHRQLAAVGAGGAMELLAQSGARYELAEARRFRRGWERQASLRLRAGDETVLREYHKHGHVIDGGTVEQAEQKAMRGWLGDTLAGRRSLLIVDTNEQAARLSARIRAELVRLGKVQNDGIRLGLDGNYAGVGDLVEARTLDWTVQGYEGNTRPAITREQYRVQGVRQDGSLQVAVVRGRTREGDVLGEQMVLPAGYVAEHLALGYAVTKNAAQGASVDTSHTVATARTGLAGFYVPMTRGMDSNTAYVVTVSEVEDPAQGGDRHTLRRDPVAVLARILDTTAAADAANQSAVATAEQSAAEAASARTAAERLADFSHLAATERTATWLDQLTDIGALRNSERARLAAEDGAATLTRILRRVELAGHNARQALHDAVTGRAFDGIRNISNAVYARIRQAHLGGLDPLGDRFADWTPRVDNPHWRAYLDTLARTADERAALLGREAAEQQPQWAVESLGPVPDNPEERAEWERRAGTVAAYREVRGLDDTAEPIGLAPKAGQVEQYAAYRAAWRALGRPEVEREELELSDGQLRVRVRAWEREQAWGPRYVANELAGTRQAAAAQRHTAVLKRAEADAAADQAERDRLRAEADEAEALARTLDERIAQLEYVDDARAQWWAHTAMTRTLGESAAAELARRHADDAEPEQQVTAEEWLAAERTARTADDAHRAITETDVADTELGEDAALSAESAERISADRDSGGAPDADVRGSDHVGAGTGLAESHVEVPEPDIREVAATEPPQRDEDVVREVPADVAVEAVKRAHRALTELAAREAEDQQAEAAERTAELARWSADDRAAGEGDDRMNDWSAERADRYADAHDLAAGYADSSA
jgi:conjugative relaxase-like TrwC/TraI family protein